MKKAANFMLIGAVLAVLSWALWRGFTHRPVNEHNEAAAPEATEAAEAEPAHEGFVVTLEKEKWKALGIETAAPEKAELAPRRVAFGRGLAPLPLVTLAGGLAAPADD